MSTKQEMSILLVRAKVTRALQALENHYQKNEDNNLDLAIARDMLKSILDDDFCS